MLKKRKAVPEQKKSEALADNFEKQFTANRTMENRIDDTTQDELKKRIQYGVTVNSPKIKTTRRRGITNQYQRHALSEINRHNCIN